MRAFLGLVLLTATASAQVRPAPFVPETTSRIPTVMGLQGGQGCDHGMAMPEPYSVPDNPIEMPTIGPEGPGATPMPNLCAEPAPLAARPQRVLPSLDLDQLRSLPDAPFLTPRSLDDLRQRYPEFRRRLSLPGPVAPPDERP
ncbi:MAG: hypothetical protein AAGK21_14660 [Bacteroidota bacterium]